MEKLLLPQIPRATSALASAWLPVETLARVEITSEDPAHPIESALALNPAPDQGWRADQPGAQTIRLHFYRPQTIHTIHLQFQETEQPRTHEFMLAWRSASGTAYQEIVRQQYAFSPPHTTEETEAYQVALEAVASLELHLVPDLTGQPAWASLTRIRLA